MRVLALATLLILAGSASRGWSHEVQGSGPPGTTGAELSEAHWAARFDNIFGRWRAVEAPGCAVAIDHKGHVLSRAFGMANLEHSIPITSNTVFEVASVSKQFTAAAVLKLVEQGRLSLTQDVRTHLPELPDYGEVITLDHLLTHTSGVPDWGALAYMAGRADLTHPPSDVIRWLTLEPHLNFRPGTEYSYSNTNYILLAMIVERVTGSTLDDFTHEALFAPLGMVSTSWRTGWRRVVPNSAMGYSPAGKGFLENGASDSIQGGSGLITTPADMLIWNRALSAGALGSVVTAELQRPGQLSTGRPTEYGRGLFLETLGGLESISHTGVTAGYVAALYRYPSERLSIALTCNRNDVPLDVVVPALTELFVSPRTVPRQAGGAKGAVEDLSRYTGAFLADNGALAYNFTAQEGSLTLQGRAMSPVARGTFRSEDRDYRFIDADTVETTGPIGERRILKRIPGPSPDPAGLQTLAGQYQALGGAVGYVVTVVEDRLRLRTLTPPTSDLMLTPLGQDVFSGPALIAHFQKDPTGAVTGFTLSHVRARHMNFRRVTDPGEPAQASR